ncbi:MAG: hypothetical protein LBR36_03100 [Bacteroidales bacterium]|jgi:hypothetical protein|nr:hypothetical protein [Bacteroidales bacterium]
MNNFGKYIRQLKIDAGLVIRKIFAQLNIDRYLLQKSMQCQSRTDYSGYAEMMNILNATKYNSAV